ncbi:metallophosphoesterase family protein [Ramlibacter monticola]|uniref:Metallophosphoesterase family protein n=1 Tax=Ramlibacter monticola TaxID=1926872 RepID=A0A936YV33_9BURK|nr:metallophosphoesterase [Ramlibacter monticola]MBL0390335.1 metallophosphoesterase family protein [Ramlibacter monticola]
MALTLHVVSDLHLSQAGMDLPATDADLVVLAGDIARPREAVAWAGALGKPVLYVPGNHEFYGGSLEGRIAELRALTEGTPVRLLHDDELVLDGVRILGTTLWTEFRLPDLPQQEAAERAATSFMRDFSRIRLREGEEALLRADDCAALFRRHSRWLRERLAHPHAGPTVVISHHAPSVRSIHPRFAGSAVNLCFASDAEYLLEGVDLWVHGHTHDSFDYRVGGTRVLCNPRGYVREGVQENARFDPALVVAVG